MYYNIETRKTASDSNIMTAYRRHKNNGAIGAGIDYETYRDSLLVQNGGPYIKIDADNTHPGVAIRRYAKAMNVKVVGHVHLVQRAQHGLMNLWEDKIGNQFWQTPDGAITLNKVAMRAAFAAHAAN